MGANGCVWVPGDSELAAVVAVRGPTSPGLPLMTRPAVGVVTVRMRGCARRGGHENYHPPVLRGVSPGCLPSSERGWLMAQGWHQAWGTIDSWGTQSNRGLGFPQTLFLLFFSEANAGSIEVVIICSNFSQYGSFWHFRLNICHP